ncbi:MAG TPA: radical SAM protein [Steroidobacter sp.]|nr:radical SAM protein [Steroidobacter sp.]
MPPQILQTDRRLRSVPLITLHLTERCNSRCVSCDYWRHGREDMTTDSVARLLPSLRELGTRAVLISGGEPLIHPQWAQISQLLREQGLQLWLVTSGLSLAKHAARAVELFQSITVSLDGIDRRMYAAIRGLDAFDTVCAGIRAAVRAGASLSVRVTVQRANYSALPAFVTLTHQLGAKQVSFVAADVRNAHAFGRVNGFNADIALQASDLPGFEKALDVMKRDHAEDFRSGFIAERPAKLHRLLEYYRAVCGLGPFPSVRCNAPEFSAVIEATGRVNPCFFIAGAPQAIVTDDLGEVLNGEAMTELRRSIREGRREECATCVCSLWRDPNNVSGLSLEPATHVM